jgi:triacylglycerol esterase/lipase EstA (alpha/beta hydrolase family)
MTLHSIEHPRNPPAAHRMRRKTIALARWLRLPGMAAPPECASIRYWDRPTRAAETRERSPVLFVHGYAGTEHIWGPLRAALADAGFGCLVAVRYNAFRADIHQVADWLVEQAQRSMDASGTGSVHLVGHSLGGLVVRDAVQHRGLAGLARTAVTIATPHTGAALARYVPGPAARQMRPGSTFLAELEGGRVDQHTRWIAVNGGADRVVPEASSMLAIPAADVLTVRQPGAGHAAVARHPDVVSYIAGALLRSEQQAAPAFSLAA